jgi:creatinine amidohydrolase
VKRVAESPRVVLVMPTGSTEQHGPHLPLGTDAYLAHAIARGAAEHAWPRALAVVAPPLTFGYSTHHLDFSGTLSLTGALFTRVCVRLCLDAVRHGFRRIVLLNGHGGNHAALEVAARTVRDRVRALVVVANYWDFVAKKVGELRESGPGGMAHACEFETSLMLHVRPESVGMALARKEVPLPKTKWITRDMFYKGTVSVAEDWADVSKSGVWGDPTLATKAKGKRLYGLLVSEVAKFLGDFSRWEIGRL